MTRTCVISLPRFIERAERIAGPLDAEVMAYSSGVFAEVWDRFDGIVALMSAGIAVRGIAPLLRNKWVDPALIVVTPDLKYAVPIVGGHHGANGLARRLQEALGVVPVLSTATECLGRPSVEGIADSLGHDIVNRDSTRMVNAAELDGRVPTYHVRGPAIVVAGPAVSVLLPKGEYVVGVGCRRGVGADEVEQALRAALTTAGITPDEVFAYATTVQKREEPGLASGIARLGGSLVLLDDDTLNRIPGCGPSKAGLIGLAGVAEPAALALARRQEWCMRKTVFGRLTIAIAR
ncbi:MAG TPA: cobalt-precorrin 5A hydrolase [Methanoregulaceae archaeon]|nr:cobalt-precorrin 5A hydrolase [Methanoregulaceae archaeon]HQJ86933.1 cobalt-precorrin 5A hydrolase [Methanoregulaceae archaeon]